MLYAAQSHDMVQPGNMDSANATTVKAAVELAYRASEGVEAIAVANHLKYSEARAALLKRPFFLFSSVRHPVARVYSQFFDNMCWREPGRKEGDIAVCQQINVTSAFGQSVLRKDTLSNRWKYVRSYAHNHCFNYMRGSATTPEAVLAQYDFVFVSERMNESLVAFMMQFGLTYEDIAHLRAKDNAGLYKKAQDMPPEMNTFVEEHNQLDVQMWTLANARLDAVIKGLQPECFKHHLAVFAEVQAAVKDGCSNYQQFYADYGLSAKTHSYVSDNGIGFRCVGHVAREFLRNSEQQMIGAKA